MDRETERVIMSIQKATLLMDPFFKVAATGTILLITYLARMSKEGKVSRGEFKDIQEFMRKSDGDYSIVNIPYEKDYSPWKAVPKEADGKTVYTVKNEMTGEACLDKNGKERTWNTASKAEKEAGRLNQREDISISELKQAGIQHVILPDLNKGDGMIQVAVFTEDKEKFSSWYGRYLASHMQGGEKSIQNLTNLTDGKTSIVSIPLEGDGAKVRSDFQSLGINYAVLPDLNVGDGEIQIVVANSDMPKVEHWYRLYKEGQMEKGNEARDLKTMDLDGYARTGEMGEEDYINTADEDFVKANEKYEGREPGEVERSVREQENKIHGIGDKAYDRFHGNPNYEEITINYETLVKKSSFGDSKHISDAGLFASRIPSTYGQGELTLVLPKEQVFAADGGRTFIGFLEKDKKPIILDADGKPVPISQRGKGKDVYDKYYGAVERGFRQKEPLPKAPQAGQTNPIKDRAPSVPIKTK